MSIKGISILILGLLFLIPLTVSAEPYNITDSATKIYSKQFCIIPPFLTTPLDPKIACDTDGSNCLALIYDTCTTSGARVLWSVDKFESHSQNLGTIGTSIGQTTFIDPYSEDSGSLYYDIAYFEDQSAFYMVFGEDVYVAFSSDIDGGGPALPLPTIYSPSSPLVTPTQIYGDTISIDCATELTTPKDWAGLGYFCLLDGTYGYKFQNENATNLWGVQLCQARDTSPSDWDGILCEWTYDVTNTTTDRFTNVVAIDNTVSCSSGGSFGVDFLSVNAFYGSTDWKYNIEGQVDYCTGTVNVAIDEDTLPTPEDDNNHHYFGGSLYYHNFSLPNISGTILSTETTDFGSFGVAQTVYSEDSTINETINQSDSTEAGNLNLYIWERNSATDQGNDGIWIYRQSNIPINIETDLETPVTAILDCTTDSGATHTDSGTGDQFTINTLCQDDNRIIFTSNFRPLTAIEFFDIDSSCITDGLSIKLKYAQTPYNHSIIVRTVDNIDVPSANVTIGSDTTLTNSEGETGIEINTVSGSSLLRINQSTCEVVLSTDGTPVSKTIEVEKAGFIDNEEIIPLPIKSFNSGFGWNEWTFTTQSIVTLQQSGTFLDIDIRAGNNVILDPCSYNVSVSGPDIIQVKQGAVFINRDYTDEFTAEFKLNHSSSPFNATVTLTLPNGSTQSEIVALTFDSETDLIIDIPFSIADLQCGASCDCPSSSCIDNFFYDLNGCTDSVCDYNIVDCTFAEFCDDTVGCFDSPTTTSCTTDFDCTDSCLDNSTMQDQQCGADGFCKNTIVECTEGCNSTLNVCQENAECLEGTSQKFSVKTPSGDGNEYTIPCNLANAGQSFCGDTIVVQKSELTAQGLTIDQMVVSPNGWNYVDDGTFYTFLAPSVTCSDSCQIEISYCSNTCDSETGDCEGIGAGIDPIASLFGGWSLAIQGFVNQVFPNIYSKSIFSLIVIMITSVALLVIGKGDKNIALYILGFDVIIALVFSFVGFLPFEVSIIGAIIAGFILFQGLFKGG